jgi:4'-phosphopantetheinyl transferase
VPPAVPAAEDGVVQVWWARRDGPGRTRTDLLQARERQRRDDFRMPADQDRYTTGVAIGRIALGALTGTEPAALVLDRSCPDCDRWHGRPRLPGSPLRISVSHSGEWVVVALATGLELGADVERLATRVQPLQLAETVLTPEEGAALRALPAARHMEAFITAWTRKEAALKATGDGLRTPLTGIVVSGWSQPAALIGYRDRPEVVAAARMYDLDAPDDYRASLVALGSSHQVTEMDATAVLSE